MELKKKSVQRITVIGNSCGGKTKLSRRLAQVHQLQVTHIDSIQFLPGMVIRPHQETLKILESITQQEKWLIDGFGPLDLIEKRFELADAIIYIDFPLWRHYWWFFKRQVGNLWSRRAELPDHCNELTLAHTSKVINSIWKVHKKMRPELIRILNREINKSKVIRIQSLKQWNSIFEHGVEFGLLY